MRSTFKCKALSLCLAFSFIFTSCSRSSREMTPEKIIDTVVENFMLLAEVPRPSHHEEKISDFFVSWAKSQNLNPVQDNYYNVMFNVPATKGYENKPLVILQGHMDMVVAVEAGKDFDPLNDPVTVIRDEQTNTLTADGTSLGGDDGIGCAIMMSVVQGKMDHGPLRIIITTDEEDGMEGMFNIDPSWLDGAKYLINIDNEASDNVVVSTAAGDSVRISGTAGFHEADGDKAFKITLSGLTGGHSGVDIDKRRLNGITGIGRLLKYIDECGVYSELAYLEGGTAPNAIPDRAVCVIVIDSKDEQILMSSIDEYLFSLQEEYKGRDDSIAIEVSEESTVPQVVYQEYRDNAVRYIAEIIDGIYTMSEDMEGLVESSSNLGLFKLDENGISASTYIRSSVAELETEILNSQLELAEECGFDSEAMKMADPWPYNPDSKLLKLTKKIYLEQNGKEIEVVAVHAGLECGTMSLLSPELDMICIGVDLIDPHTTRETVILDSVPVCWNLLSELLLSVD